MSRIVIALGGNALGTTYLEQQNLIKQAAKDLAELFYGNEIIITHGNGPQVGMITKAFGDEIIEMPLDCCTAMSDGYIGFHIQRELKEVLKDIKMNRDVITVITEVVVDSKDPSFKNPTKPIGKFYTKDEVDVLSKNSKDIYIEDAGRGYRKVVASPKPIDIVNLRSMETLLKNGSIVIACGGGGVPILSNPDTTGVDAVIDKDLTSSLLAIKLHADKLIILTAVDQVSINFGKENEQKLDKLSIKDAEKYLKSDEFKKGSMLPKVEAALEFTRTTGNETIITSLSNIKNIQNGKNITVICKN
jgi:carbamate kinase